MLKHFKIICGLLKCTVSIRRNGCYYNRNILKIHNGFFYKYPLLVIVYILSHETYDITIKYVSCIYMATNLATVQLSTPVPSQEGNKEVPLLGGDLRGGSCTIFNLKGMGGIKGG